MLSVSVPAPHPSEWVSEECWNGMEEFQRGSDEIERERERGSHWERERERECIYTSQGAWCSQAQLDYWITGL